MKSLIEHVKRSSSIPVRLCLMMGDDAYNLDCDHLECIDEEIGSGEEGACYRLTDGRVLKVFYRGLPVSVQLLARACKNHKFKTLPRILDFGDSWIVREYFEIGTSSCKAALRAIEAFSNGDKVDRRFKSWTARADEELRELHAGGLHLFDAKIDNIGERDGVVTLIDF